MWKNLYIAEYITDQMRLLGYILLFSVVLHTHYKSIVVTTFELTRPYIAANFCEQKEVENNCCQASCVLQKTLTVDDIFEAFLLIHSEILLSVEQFVLHLSPPSPALLFAYPPSFGYRLSILSGIEFDLLRPPIK